MFVVTERVKTLMGMTMVKTHDVRDCENGSSQDKSEANDDW